MKSETMTRRNLTSPVSISGGHLPVRSRARSPVSGGKPTRRSDSSRSPVSIRSLSGLRPGNCDRDQRPAVSDHRSAVSKPRPAVRSSGQRSQSIRSRPGLKVKTDQAGQIPARSPVSIRSQRPAVSKSGPRPGGQIPPGHGLRSARSETRGARSDSVRSPVSARSHNLVLGLRISVRARNNGIIA